LHVLSKVFKTVFNHILHLFTITIILETVTVYWFEIQEEKKQQFYVQCIVLNYIFLNLNLELYRLKFMYLIFVVISRFVLLYLINF